MVMNGITHFSPDRNRNVRYPLRYLQDRGNSKHKGKYKTSN